LRRFCNVGAVLEFDVKQYAFVIDRDTIIDRDTNAASEKLQLIAILKPSARLQRQTVDLE
jgi:hypothetical protein